MCVCVNGVREVIKMIPKFKEKYRFGDWRLMLFQRVKICLKWNTGNSLRGGWVTSSDILSVC